MSEGGDTAPGTGSSSRRPLVDMMPHGADIPEGSGVAESGGPDSADCADRTLRDSPSRNPNAQGAHLRVSNTPQKGLRSAQSGQWSLPGLVG